MANIQITMIIYNLSLIFKDIIKVIVQIMATAFARS